MIPPLPVTDVVAHQPDVDGLDLWGMDFSWKVLLGPGVYCFYDADTKEILYIGSAISTKNHRVECRGLASRLAQYRTVSRFTKKIREERHGRRMLVRCWTAKSSGDALKYEYDAIEKYRPILNSRMAKLARSREELLLVAKETSQRYRETPRERMPPETTLKKCPKCGEIKSLSCFHKSAVTKSGHQPRCKDCRKKPRRAISS